MQLSGSLVFLSFFFLDGVFNVLIGVGVRFFSSFKFLFFYFFSRYIVLVFHGGGFAFCPSPFFSLFPTASSCTWGWDCILIKIVRRGCTGFLWREGVS